jgi:hypothetical protein
MRQANAASAARGPHSRALLFVWLLAICAVFAASLAWRAHNLFERPLLSHNEDATAHVLFTLEAQHRLPAASHRYLPVLTAAGEGNAGIDNFQGASVSDGDGLHYYVSFPPFSFAAPALLLKAIPVGHNLIGLRAISLATGLIAALAATILLWQVLPAAPQARGFRSFVALAGGLLYLLHPEALWSHGNIVWAHVLYHPVLLLSCIALAAALRQPGLVRFAVLALLVYLGALLDWSGYLFSIAAGLALLGWAWRTRTVAFVPGACAAVLAGILSGITTLAHWGQKFAVPDILAALVSRTRSHNVAAADLAASVELLLLYLGPALLAAAILLVIAVAGKRARLAQFVTPEGATILFVFAFTTLESALFLRHATWYAYGMLKPIHLAILVLCHIAMGLALTAPTRRWSVAGSAFAALALYGIVLYPVQNPAALTETAFAKQFDELEAIGRIARSDEIVFANLSWPLGVELARSGRNIVSDPHISINPGITLASAQQWLARNGHRGRARYFYFDRSAQGETGLSVWWPVTKSEIVQPAPYPVGRLLAVVSFDKDGVLGHVLTAAGASPGAAGDPQFRAFMAQLPQGAGD